MADQVITPEEVEIFHSMHELLAVFSIKLDHLERELLNIKHANLSQISVIDRAISNIGEMIKGISVK